MHIKSAFALRDPVLAHAIAREHPFATLITSDLRATHMPCLVEEDVPELTLLGHVARADPVAEQLDGPLLVIFAGPRGYISASWYASDTIPTWNHVTLHVRGTAELLDDALPVLRRTVDHFEARVRRPWSLDRMGDEAREMAREVVAFRFRAQSWHAEAKLSQDKPASERSRILAGLQAEPAYENPELVAAMRRVSTER